jgi:hypothetical protein
MRFPSSTRLLLVLAFIFGFTQIAPALAATADSILANAKPGPYTDLDLDRPGKDYKNFEVDSNFNTCEVFCNREAACKAWTWVKPGLQGAKARCWLKTGVPRAYRNGCCVSGLKAGYCDSGMSWDAGSKKCVMNVK